MSNAYCINSTDLDIVRFFSMREDHQYAIESWTSIDNQGISGNTLIVYADDTDCISHSVLMIIENYIPTKPSKVQGPGC